MPTILNFPDIGIDSLEWRLMTVTESFASPETGHEQTAELPGVARWMATMTISDVTREEAVELEAHLVELLGPAGRFYLGNPARAIPRGVATGTPVVDGAANYGGALATRGWTPNVAGILKRGDYFAVGNEVKMLRADANSDALGKATLLFRPNLRNVPADGAAVVVSNWKGIFRLVDDNQIVFKYSSATMSCSFSALETWW